MKPLGGVKMDRRAIRRWNSELHPEGIISIEIMCYALASFSNTHASDPKTRATALNWQYIGLYTKFTRIWIDVAIESFHRRMAKICNIPIDYIRYKGTAIEPESR